MSFILLVRKSFLATLISCDYYNYKLFNSGKSVKLDNN